MGLKVLSLFDGMSCGRIALERVGIEVDNYYASEVDKYAIKVSNHNYPTIEHVGDVRLLESSNFKEIDLLIGGSPCQNFSFAGNMKGSSTTENIEVTSLEQYLKLKKEGFEFIGQSYLVWEFVRMVKEVKPKYFMLENVVMTKKWEYIINEALGIEPIKINSSLVSAQNRERLYWTNIPNIHQPEDKGIYLKDVILDNEELIGAAMRGRYENNGKTNQFIELRKDKKDNYLTTSTKNSLCVMVGKNEIKGFDIIKRVYSTEGKCPTLTTMQGGHREPKIAINEIEWRKLLPIECERLQTVPEKEIKIEVVLCEESAKNFVNAVKRNHTVLKNVLNAEKTLLKEFARIVEGNTRQKNLKIKRIVQKNVNMETQKKIKEFTKNNQKESFIIAKNAENETMYNFLNIEEVFVEENVFMNITEGKIMQIGKAESLQKDKNFILRKNGNNALKISGNEIMQLVEYAQKDSVIKTEKNSTFITLDRLNVKNIEMIIATCYWFAKNVIDGYTVKKTQKKTLSLNVIEGYTSIVSNSQRYKMLGNGWTIDVIAHIFKGLK